ncbi:MAG: DNA repair protein RadA [Candidatus Gracilibacteria bacterium]
MKLKTVYACQNCAFQTGKWLGKCPNCDQWNTMVEDVINVGKSDSTVTGRRGVPRTPEKPQAILQSHTSKARILTGIGEFDQVIGGGFVDGSLILLSGEPGIGKSTLTLQITDRMAAQKEKVLYITGEESVEQVADRAKRLGSKQENIELLYENNLENILTTLENTKPDFLVIDSIQVMFSNDIPGVAGSLSQVRYVTEVIMNTIKTHKIPTLLIGHVNKEGNIAGPKVLEHLVDTVLILEGERDHEFRMLRAMKNRFGPINEVGMFEMTERGLTEQANLGEKILKNSIQGRPGTALTITMEGNRPLLMEIQALVSGTPFGYPKRMANGIDRNRMELLIAVLQKHTSLSLADQDVYVKVTGGLSVQEPAADLAICAAIVSSFLQIPTPRILFWGEVDLSGNVRKAPRLEQREKAAEKVKLDSTFDIKDLKTLVSFLSKTLPKQ